MKFLLAFLFAAFFFVSCSVPTTVQQLDHRQAERDIMAQRMEKESDLITEKTEICGILGSNKGKD